MTKFATITVLFFAIVVLERGCVDAFLRPRLYRNVLKIRGGAASEWNTGGDDPLRPPIAANADGSSVTGNGGIPQAASIPVETVQAADTAPTSGEGEKPKKRISLFLEHLQTFIPTNLVRRGVQNLLGLFIVDDDLLKMAVKVVNLLIWTYVVLCALGTVGIDTKPILSAMSVFGLTIGLASREVLSSIFAGMYILIMRPFSRGDIIEVQAAKNLKGKVISVDVQYVRLQSLTDGSEILIPISTVYKSPLVFAHKASSQRSWAQGSPQPASQAPINSTDSQQQ
jgi:hypothetical protein